MIVLTRKKERERRIGNYAMNIIQVNIKRSNSTITATKLHRSMSYGRATRYEVETQRVDEVIVVWASILNR